jgi:hypothetical protein
MMIIIYAKHVKKGIFQMIMGDAPILIIVIYLIKEGV